MLAELAARWERIRTSLWFIPALMIVAAAVLAWASLQVGFGASLGPVWWLNQGDASNASALLSSLLSALITMATLVVSITMVVLTLAAGQLGPRLLRTFMGDKRTQFVLGLFTATIVYLLLILRLLRTDVAADAVPHFAVTLGSALMLLCIFALLFYVHHLARSIISDNVINRVGRELDHTIAEAETAEDGEPRPSRPAAGASALMLRRSGYVQAVETRTIVRAASEHGVRVDLLFRPGSHVLAGRPFALVTPGEAAGETLDKAISGAVAVGSERTAVQDLEFGIRQIVEVAIRALSPGINDSFTAISAIDRLASALAKMMERPDPKAAWRDDEGAVRLTIPTTDFAGALDTAFNQIRQAGRGNVAVLVRLMEALAALSAAPMAAERRAALARHARLVLAEGQRSIDEPEDLAVLAERHATVRATAGSRAEPAPPGDRRA